MRLAKLFRSDAIAIGDNADALYHPASLRTEKQDPQNTPRCIVITMKREHERHDKAQTR